jgi:hypothetical protein
MVREAERCAGCGTRPAEWDPERGGHPQAYVASGRMCPGCFALDAGSKQWEGAAGIHPELKPNLKTREGGAPNGRA